MEEKNKKNILNQITKFHKIYRKKLVNKEFYFEKIICFF